MKKWGKIYRRVLWFFVYITVILLTEGKEAEASEGTAADYDRYVVDQADLLTDQEEAEIGSYIEEMSETWKQDYVVVTTDDAEGKDSEEYADDYYDYHGYQENGVLYLIDMDNRNVWISTSGAMIQFLTDSRIESVIDAGYGELKAGNYGQTFLFMLERTAMYMEKGIPDNQYTYNRDTGEVIRHYALSGWEITLAVIAALVCGGAFFGVTRARYQMKMGNYTYPFREKGRVRYTRREDLLVNQTITHRKIPKDPPSGGGGGQSSVHISSSGSSHGGGGRGF